MLHYGQGSTLVQDLDDVHLKNLPGWKSHPSDQPYSNQPSDVTSHLWVVISIRRFPFSVYERFTLLTIPIPNIDSVSWRIIFIKAVFIQLYCLSRKSSNVCHGSGYVYTVWPKETAFVVRHNFIRCICTRKDLFGNSFFMCISNALGNMSFS